MSLFNELKRRNVLRVAVAYLAASWLLIQILETLFPIFGADETSIRFVVIALAIGFIPALILSWVFEFTAGGIQRDEDVQRGADGSSSGNKILDRAIMITLTVALAYFAADKFILDPGRDAERERVIAERTRTETLVSSYGDQSIAVLPFVNMSSDPEQEYFSDGIAEEILNLLSRITDLRVISRSSSFVFKGQDVEIPVIASRLNVAHILEGSVRKSGNRVRVTVQLIDARTDTHLWSDTFDRDLDDIFAIQDEISAKVVAQLKITILGNLPSSVVVDTTAYGLYLRARHINHSGLFDQIPLAVELLTEALELQPDYVPAMSELARIQLSSRYDFGFASQQERRQSVRALVDRISQVAPGAKEELAWRAWIAATWDSDPQTAAQFMELGLLRYPNDLDILRSVSWFLADLGRIDDALALSEYVALRDPECISCLVNLSTIHRQAGQYESAEKILRDAIEWSPDRYHIYWALGSVLLMAGKPDEALATFERDKSAGPLGRIMALHDLGRLAEFEIEFATLRSEEQVDYEGIARIYAWTGDNDKALEWLDKLAEQNGQRTLDRLGVGFYDKLKLDPRFEQLMLRHGIDTTPYDDIRFEFTPPE